MNRGLISLLTFAVGAMAANLYYAQPIVGLISRSLHIQPGAAGLVVTLTQAGYGLGVLFLVPLGDMVENRKLILSHLLLTILGLLGLAFSTQWAAYFMAAFATGIGASAVQIIVPYAAHLASEENRGRIVGNLMGGLMLGIMLSRPMASFLTDLTSWHAIFVFSAVLMGLLMLLLYRALPARQPEKLNLSYLELLHSMFGLFMQNEVLRRRSFYQAALFGSFCLFWTASPLWLSSPTFQLSQTAIALFALVGVSGTVSAPMAGKFADRGFIRIGTRICLLFGAGSFLLTKIFQAGSLPSLIFLGVAAIFLDAGVSANLVLGQRAIFSLPAIYRSRLNGIYIAIIFVGGGLGSALGAWTYARGGWSMAAWTGVLMPALAFIYFLTDKMPDKVLKTSSTQLKENPLTSL